MSTPKLNVGIFTYDFYPFVGGQGKHVYELFKQNLKFSKINLYVFSPTSNILKNHIQIFTETKNSKLKNIEFSFRLSQQIYNLIDRFSLDLVHMQGGPGGIFFLNKIKVPVIYTCHHTYWQQSNYIDAQKWKKIFQVFEKKGYQNADSVVCVSADTLRIVQNMYGINQHKLTLITNGIHLSKHNDHQVKISKDLLYLGRIDKRKGLDFLLQGMQVVNRKFPQIRLNVVGEGKDRKRLEELVALKKLNVKYHGFLEEKELDVLYKKIAIQVVPSVFEGFGMSVLDAMARKIPVIATNVDGIRSLINKNTGVLIEYGNIEGLANAIVDLIKDKPKRATIALNAYKNLKNYNWQDIYFKIVRIYEQAVI